MASNQLPENMGKKIVEALRKQAQANSNNDFSSNINNIKLEEDTETMPVEETTPVVEEETVISPTIQAAQSVQTVQPTIQQSQFTQQTFQAQLQMQEMNEPPLQFTMSGIQASTQYNSLSQELPTNVAVLKKLITQLPAGVSKQIGAQIIRQTIEALGISMNSVLQEAQQVQDGLNSAVTDCTLKMQEYKNQIMQLEANTRDYQRQMAQINDLISLFILTDNK
ncbi:MAG: hypothetical protein ACI37Z_04760 [Candidatus Gastranaerophilaceae bacterium]